MKQTGKLMLLSLISAVTLQVEANEISGFLKYMHAGAKNQDSSIDKSSNVLGLELGYRYDFNENFSAQATFMGIQPVGGGNNCARVIGSKYTGTDGFSVLGEAYFKYEDEKNEITLGRQKINTPLLASNPTNMTYETFIHVGTFEALRYQREFSSNTSLDFSLITKYKHRTSNKFYSIGENITGDKTLDTDYIALLGIQHSFNKSLNMQVWALKADNLMSTFYAQIDYKTKLNSIGLNFALQGLNQNIHSQAKNTTSNPYLKVDDSSLVGAKVALSHKGMKLMLAASRTGDSQIILPWDGSPAFTKICVTSAMTKSIKGSGLKKYAGAYSANTTAYKAAFIQNFARFGLPNLKAVAAYTLYDSKAASVNQKNKMLYLKYNFDGKLNGLSLAAAYTKIDNFDARTKVAGKKNPKAWTIQSGQEYEHYKLMLSYRF
jgi:hypothetical protein